MKYSWEMVYAKLKEAPAGKLFGVPRGGAIVAGLTGRAVDSVEAADWIVDDIVDSGVTKARYQQKPFWALHAKQPGEGWITFPWEDTDPTADLADTVRRQLEFIGEDPARDGLLDTPARVIKALTEMTAGMREDPATILGTTFDVPFDELVMLRDVPFSSLCEHHMLPFTGHVTVGYLPGSRVVGISKIARLVSCRSMRLQVQERMTHQIAEDLMEHLKPRGVGVIVSASHQCMACRGVRMQGTTMVTSSMLGEFRDSAQLRSEFLALTQRNG